jgi:hypothetical protein
MPLATRGTGVSIPSTNQVVISTTIDVLDDSSNNIGFVSQITRRDERPTSLIRHLDSLDAGRVIEQAPGVETNRLEVAGFALYTVNTTKNSLIDRVARKNDVFWEHSCLNANWSPFAITERQTHPQGVSYSETLYGECLLTSYSRPVNITTATIAETANIQVSWIETS